MDTDEKLHDVIAPDFHTLWHHKELVAVAAYCKRTVRTNSKDYTAYYIRYFSVSPNHQGKGLGKLLTQKLEEHYRSTINTPTLFYAYIEKKNLRSMGVSNYFNPEVLGQFKSVLFSRFTPKKHSNFGRVDAKEFSSTTSEHYQQHALFSSEKLGYKNNCFGIKRNGEWVATVQANPVQWRVVNLPGFMGWLSRNVLHFIPVLGRMAPRNEFKFAAFEGLWVHPDHQDLVKPLLESCLAQHRMNVGMAYYDLKDSTYLQLSSLDGMGMMAKIQNPPPVNILCFFLHFTEEQKQDFFGKPSYLSCFDLT